MRPEHINTLEFLSHLCAVCEEHGFVLCTSAEWDTELSSTAFRTIDNMFPYEHSDQKVIPVTKVHRELASKILEWAREYYEAEAKKEFSIFTHYMNIALDGDTFAIHYPGYVASVYKTYVEATGLEATVVV